MPVIRDELKNYVGAARHKQSSLHFLAPPQDSDRALPRRLKPGLVDLARLWTTGADTPRTQVDALVARMRQDFDYSHELSTIC